MAATLWIAVHQVSKQIARDGIDHGLRQRRNRRPVLSAVKRRSHVKALAWAERAKHVLSPLPRQALDTYLAARHPENRTSGLSGQHNNLTRAKGSPMRVRGGG